MESEGSCKELENDAIRHINMVLSPTPQTVSGTMGCASYIEKRTNTPMSRVSSRSRNRLSKFSDLCSYRGALLALNIVLRIGNIDNKTSLTAKSITRQLEQA